VEDVLERCAGVRREAEAADAGVACDARGGEHKAAREVRVGEIGHGADVSARDDEHVKRGRAWLRVERDDVGVLEADGRRSFVSGDPAEDAVAPRVDSRP
jgi:hypothetical protein